MFLNSSNPELYWLYSFFLHWFFPLWLDFKKILFSNFRKTWLNLYLCGRGPIKPVLFVCPSVTHLYVLIGFSEFFAWGCFSVYTTKWQSWFLQNRVCCLDNCVNEINLDQKRKIYHFNESSITFCVDAP